MCKYNIDMGLIQPKNDSAYGFGREKFGSQIRLV